MKLSKVRAYTYKDKDYHRWRVDLPAEHIQALGWEHGQELEAVLKKDGLLLRGKAE